MRLLPTDVALEFFNAKMEEWVTNEGNTFVGDGQENNAGLAHAFEEMAIITAMKTIKKKNLCSPKKTINSDTRKKIQIRTKTNRKGKFMWTRVKAAV